MNDFRLGDKVKVISGKFQGYYGVIVELLEAGARVSHDGEFKGHWVLFADLKADA
jgi:ribosomal protein L24